jgi:hypothetical protein
MYGSADDDDLDIADDADAPVLPADMSDEWDIIF